MDIQLSNKEIKNIYNVYREQIWKFVFSRIHNNEIAEDITQETFLRLVKHRNKKRNIKTWLFFIANNIIIDEYRKLIYRNERLERFRDEVSDLYKYNYDYKPFFINKEIFFNVLTEKQKFMFILRYMEEKKSLEITEITGYNKFRINSLIHRGLQKIRNEVLPNINAY